jgi:hypothetical protein
MSSFTSQQGTLLGQFFAFILLLGDMRQRYRQQIVKGTAPEQATCFLLRWWRDLPVYAHQN